MGFFTKTPKKCAKPLDKHPRMRYYIANLSSRYLTKKERTAMTNRFAACMIARMCMPMGMARLALPCV